MDQISMDGVEIKESLFQLIGKKPLATGSFGHVYLTRNIKTNERFATKLISTQQCGTSSSSSSLSSSSSKLKKEYDWYQLLGTFPGLAKIYHFGDCFHQGIRYEAMVMELLGPNLEDVFAANNNNFTIGFTTRIAIMILEIMRFIHSKKIIFGNVKPANFCLGPPKTTRSQQVYLIGLTNAKYFETNDSKHIPKFNSKDEKFKNSGPSGTPRYMSLNAHKGKELSRRDDLESIGYMLLYFLHGKLPWQGLTNSNNNNNNNNNVNPTDKYQQIYNIKKMIHLDELCANLPPEFYHYMLYVRTLKFAQEPNYRYLIQMFTRLLYRINMERLSQMDNLTDMGNIDWDLRRHLNIEANSTQLSSQNRQITESTTSMETITAAPVTSNKKQVKFQFDTIPESSSTTTTTKNNENDVQDEGGQGQKANNNQ